MRLRPLIAAALLLTAGCDTAQAMSARDLLNSCDAALRTIKDSGKELSIAPAGQRCWNYMEAVQDMVALADEDGHRLLGVCVPEDGRTDGLVRAFTKHAHGHPEELETRAAIVVLHGLWAEFPCK
jgi:hypothetical protein